jgi:hypothetical protein
VDTDTRWNLFAQTWDERREGEEKRREENHKGERSCNTGKNNAERSTEERNCENNDICSEETNSENGNARGLDFGRLYAYRRYVGGGDSDPPPPSLLNNHYRHDVHCPIHRDGYDLLKDSGVPEGLAHHVASLFVRDPLVMFREKLDLNNEIHTDHWDSLNSTNWGVVRIKTPVEEEVEEVFADSDQGGKNDGSEQQSNKPQMRMKTPWRFEFRSPEVQPTDFENAAIVIVLAALVRLVRARRGDVVVEEVLTRIGVERSNPNLMQEFESGDKSADRNNRNNDPFLVDFRIPISVNDMNMDRSSWKNAVTEQRFFFPRDYLKNSGGNSAHGDSDSELGMIPQRTLADILFGDESKLKSECGVFTLAEEIFCAEQEMLAGRSTNGNTDGAGDAANSTGDAASETDANGNTTNNTSRHNGNNTTTNRHTISSQNCSLIRRSFELFRRRARGTLKTPAEFMRAHFRERGVSLS